MRRPESRFGARWAPLATLRKLLAPPGDPLEPLGGPSEAPRRPLGGPLEASWRPLGGFLDALGAPLGALGSPRADLGALQKRY